MRNLLLAGLLLSVATACATSIVSPAGGSGGTGGQAGGGSGGSAGGAGDGGGGGNVGPCVTAQDCAGSSDACNVGTCINGACEQVPANEGTPCDDGKSCTVSDTCQNGACASGNLKFCPSADNCHVGFCNPMTDACEDVAGNDGAPCDDMDACTQTGTCANGACSPGPQVDCSFLDGTCSIGVCDAQLGCVVSPQNDGTACDDGLYCTINDACTAGSCGGVPNTCAAPGDVCMIGTCDEASDTCVAVPGNDGAACNDGNDCTIDETCSAGSCGGGVPGNNGAACDDGDGCTSGTTCSAGNCTNATSVILACLDGDACCPAACAPGTDSDCQVCHPIMGPPSMQPFSCPSGATQFCAPPPLDPTSSAQAKIACEACYGAPCFLEDADCAGPGWGPQPLGQYMCGDAYFGFTSGCSGDDGRVWSICGSNTTYGYWGK